ncbi:MAG: FAD-binding protein [Acidimicrobiaceae bacterium]|nr:FAD-binding protein [Acidimicrobiaceae bacterium]
MRIAVLVKQIPAPVEFRMQDGRLVRDGVPLEVNAYCRRANAKAVELAGADGEVVAFTMGPPAAADALREMIACGASRGVHLCDAAFAGSDTLATAVALASAIRREGPFDLVLAGLNSLDSDTGQVPVETAELLGLPFAAGVRHLEVADGAFTARLETDDGYSTVTGGLPAALSAAERLCSPSKAPPEARAAVDEALILRLSADDLDVPAERLGAAGSPTSVGRVRVLTATRKALRASSVAHAVDLLQELGAFSDSAAEEAAGVVDEATDGDTRGIGGARGWLGSFVGVRRRWGGAVGGFAGVSGRLGSFVGVRRCRGGAVGVVDVAAGGDVRGIGGVRGWLGLSSGVRRRRGGAVGGFAGVSGRLGSFVGVRRCRGGAVGVVDVAAGGDVRGIGGVRGWLGLSSGVRRRRGGAVGGFGEVRDGVRAGARSVAAPGGSTATMLQADAVTAPAAVPAGDEQRSVWCFFTEADMGAELLGEATELAACISGSVTAVTTIADAACGRDFASAGADRILVIDSAAEPSEQADALATAAAERLPWALLVEGTRSGRVVASIVAARCGWGLTGDAVGLEVGPDGRRLVAWKPAFGGRLQVPITSRSPVQMATVRPGVLARRPPRRHAPQPQVEMLPDPARSSLCTVDREQDDDDVGELRRARSVVAVGVGVTPDGYPLIDELRAALGGAALGATRRVTDQGWVPRGRQIGVTGHAVAPRLLVAVGCSGRFNHTVGIRNAGTLLAINSDPEAEIFDQVDIGLVGEWQSVVPELTAELRRRALSQPQLDG